MAARKISTGQVVNCLLKGTIDEPVHLNTYGDNKASLRRRCAGKDLIVSVAIDLENSLVIITTYER